MSRLHMMPKEIEERKQLHEAFDRWCASPEVRQQSFCSNDPFPMFRAAFEAGRLEAELDHLGLERIEVQSWVAPREEFPQPEEWVVHRGQTYRKKRTKS